MLYFLPILLVLGIWAAVRDRSPKQAPGLAPQGSGPPLPPPPPNASPEEVVRYEMVPDLMNETLDLLANGRNAAAMNQAANELDKEGFPQVAALLRQRAIDIQTGRSTLPIPLPPGLGQTASQVPGVPNYQVPGGISLPPIPGGINFPTGNPLSVPGGFGFPSTGLILARVTTQSDPLRIRNSPDPVSPILRLVNRGETVTVLDQSNPTFYKVNYQGTEGWAAKQFLTLI